jgi:hypothetical protein
MESIRNSELEKSPDTTSAESDYPALSPEDRRDLDRRLREAARILAKGVVRAALAAKTVENEVTS